MAGKKQWAICGLTLAALSLAVGLDISRTPAPQPSPGFSLIDAVSAATRPGMSVVGLIGSDYERLEAPVSRGAELTESQVEDMVRQAVAMAGGLYNRIAPDAEWVVIKPNIVELKTRESAVITDWRVVKALVKIVYEVVPQARVTIAEGGAWVPPERAAQVGESADSNVGDGFAIAGFRQLLTDPELAGIDLDIVDLNFDETAEVEVPDGGYVFPKYHVPLTVLECDFLITVPVLKIIGGVGMTNAMKNFVGIAPGLIYGWPKMRGYPGALPDQDGWSQPVYEHQGRRRHHLPNDRERVQIHAGPNTVLVRAGQTRSSFDFNLNICEVETDPRYDGNRVWGLKFTVPAGQTPAAGQVDELAFTNEESGEIPADATILQGIRVDRYRDPLIGALEGSLRFMGEEIPLARLSGVAGRAFRLCVADSLDRDEAAKVALSSTADLYANLGYRVRVISVPEEAPNFIASQQEAWEAIRASIDRKAPAIAHTGWSYGLVNGYHPRKEQYYAARDRGRQSRIESDELGAGDHGGGLNVLLFEERQPVDPRTAERSSLRFAVEEARRQDAPGSRLHSGLNGFAYWIEATEKGAIADDHDLSYIIAEMQENRTAAGEYLRGISSQYPDAVAASLRQAGECYDREVEYLDRLAELVPYRRNSEVDMEDPQARQELGKLLRQAYSWERQAVEEIERTLVMLPENG